MGLKQVVLTVSAQELTTVLAALDELPGRISRPLHLKLSQQVEQQLALDEQREAGEKLAAEQALREKIKAEMAPGGEP